MPRDLFEKVFQGQPFKPGAQLWNQILDAVRFVMEQERRKGRREPPLRFKYFRITGATVMSVVSEGDLAQWIYTGDEVVPIKFDPDHPERDRYSPKAGGLTDVKLYNDAEERDPNHSDEQFITNSLPSYGNGVVVADLPEGMRVSHIPIGRVVRAYYTMVAGGAEWRFDSPNGINGDCTLDEGSGS